MSRVPEPAPTVTNIESLAPAVKSTVPKFWNVVEVMVVLLAVLISSNPPLALVPATEPLAIFVAFMEPVMATVALASVMVMPSMAAVFKAMVPLASMLISPEVILLPTNVPVPVSSPSDKRRPPSTVKFLPTAMSIVPPAELAKEPLVVNVAF